MTRDKVSSGCDVRRLRHETALRANKGPDQLSFLYAARAYLGSPSRSRCGFRLWIRP